MSSSNRGTTSSGSEGNGRSSGSNGMDEKKRRRMESNRESARRSRQRKQQHLDDLIKEIGRLTRENEEFGKKIGELTQTYAAVEAANAVLTAEKNRLAAMLESLECVIDIARVVRGGNPLDNGINNVCDQGAVDQMMMMMNPWQLPSCPSMPIMASSGMFHF
ncbi:hypothetical protein Ancab_012998 [Ancistrocladus abbreviatus]